MASWDPPIFGLSSKEPVLYASVLKKYDVWMVGEDPTRFTTMVIVNEEMAMLAMVNNRQTLHKLTHNKTHPVP